MNQTMRVARTWWAETGSSALKTQERRGWRFPHRGQQRLWLPGCAVNSPISSHSSCLLSILSRTAGWNLGASIFLTTNRAFGSALEHPQS
jgi:hypothetical protein